MRIAPVALALLLAGVALDAGPARGAPIDWNDAGIRWRSYESGHAEALREGRPLLLVFYAEWCPRCRQYGRLFRDPRVMERARDFVMVRVDTDRFEALSRRHGPDGTYVPRTFFAPVDGKPDLSIQSGRSDYRYFLDPRDAAGLLARMEEALVKHRRAHPGSPPAAAGPGDPIVACPENGRTVYKHRSACASL